MKRFKKKQKVNQERCGIIYNILKWDNGFKGITPFQKGSDVNELGTFIPDHYYS